MVPTSLEACVKGKVSRVEVSKCSGLLMSHVARRTVGSTVPVRFVDMYKEVFEVIIEAAGPHLLLGGRPC
jgi:hypothetical protein